MNLLLLTSNREPKDGWSVVGFNLAKELKKNSYIQTFSSERKHAFFFGESNLKSQRFDRLGFFAVFFDVLNILFCLKKIPDVIHCNVEHYAVAAMIISKILRVPYTVTCHGTYGALLPSLSKTYKRAYEESNAIITVSEYTKKRMEQEGIKARYVVIRNGVDKKTFKPKINPHKKNTTITFVGNLKERKGAQFLLNSMVKVNKLKPEIKVLILGYVDKHSKEFIAKQKFIQKNLLNAEFVGKVSQQKLISYYQNARLNVLPSKSSKFYFEGFGLIHLEANACGTLTVGCSNSGNEDAIYPGNGFLIRYGDTKKLSEIILSIFSKKYYPKIDMNPIADWLQVSKEYQHLWSSFILNS